jgi:hypothetical protein
MLPLPNDP